MPKKRADLSSAPSSSLIGFKPPRFTAHPSEPAYLKAGRVLPTSGSVYSTPVSGLTFLRMILK